MQSDRPANPQINVSKIAVGGGIAGAIFTAGSMLIFLLGIPLLRFVFPAAIILGSAVALALHFVRHETPGASWLLSVTEKKAENPVGGQHKPNLQRSAMILSPGACNFAG
jgi:hypothetical protein